MSVFSEFDRLRNTVNQLMGDFDTNIGGGRMGRRRGRGLQQPFGGGISDVGFGGFGGISDPFWDMDMSWGGSSFDTMPLLMPTCGGIGQQPLLTTGTKLGEEVKMEDTGAAPSTALTQQRGGALQLPTLRCRVNVEDKENLYVVTAEVPGFDKQNLKVNVSDDNILTISGEQKKEHIDESRGKNYLRVERSFGQVQRSLRLPKNVDKSAVQAHYENGILHVDVPKIKSKEKEESAIKIA